MKILLFSGTCGLALAQFSNLLILFPRSWEEMNERCGKCKVTYLVEYVDIETQSNAFNLFVKLKGLGCIRGNRLGCINCLIALDLLASNRLELLLSV